MLARLFHQLAPFHPTQIGTFPLGPQVDGSDLDIACTCDDLDAFERALRTALSDLPARPRLARYHVVGAPRPGGCHALARARVRAFSGTCSRKLVW